MEYTKPINNIVETISTVLEYQSKIDKLLDVGPASYYMKQLKIYMDTLFNRFAPFKVGSKVKLNKDIGSALKPDSGWYCFRKMLHEGATGIIKEIDVNSDNKFVAGVIFDTHFSVDSFNENKKYITYDPEHKGMFFLSEDDLQLIDENDPIPINSHKMVQLELPFTK